MIFLITLIVSIILTILKLNNIITTTWLSVYLPTIIGFMTSGLFYGLLVVANGINLKRKGVE